MTEWLWTDESAYCECGHHVVDHYYKNCDYEGCFVEIDGVLQHSPHCHGRRKNFFCKCKGFEPYKVKPGTYVETEPLEVAIRK